MALLQFVVHVLTLAKAIIYLNFDPFFAKMQKYNFQYRKVLKLTP
jgi:hypothetical protein